MRRRPRSARPLRGLVALLTLDTGDPASTPMARMARITAMALVALFVTGCLRDPDPFPLVDGHLTVHFLLEAGADSVVGLVTRSTESLSERDIPDAAVTVSTGADAVTLTYEPHERCAELWLDWPTNIGCYQAALPEPVEPGRTYDLEVVLADGTRATGQTTAPLPLALTAPGEGEALVVDCDHPISCGAALHTQPTVAEWTLRWSAAEQPAGVSIALVPTAVFLDDQLYPGDTCRPSYPFRPHTMAEDSAVWRVHRFDCLDPLRPARFDSIHADLVVHALNGEYQRYTEAMADETVRVDAAAEGVEGAWGVFGAVAPIRRHVVIVRDPPPGPPPNTR